MKKIFPLLALLLLASLVGFQTLAYFTTQATAENTVTTGKIEMDLYNMTLDENGELAPLQTQIENIMPGDTYIQMPFVENTGEQDFYARVLLQSTITDGKGNQMANPLQFNIDSTKWVLDEDGWYRYVDIIPAGQTAPDPLFSAVYFPGQEMGNEYVGSTTNIVLQGQSVQAAHNQHDDVLDVQGWPAVGGTE